MDLRARMLKHLVQNEGKVQTHNASIFLPPDRMDFHAFPREIRNIIYGYYFANSYDVPSLQEARRRSFKMGPTTPIEARYLQLRSLEPLPRDVFTWARNSATLALIIGDAYHLLQVSRWIRCETLEALYSCTTFRFAADAFHSDFSLSVKQDIVDIMQHVEIQIDVLETDVCFYHDPPCQTLTLGGVAYTATLSLIKQINAWDRLRRTFRIVFTNVKDRYVPMHAPIFVQALKSLSAFRKVTIAVAPGSSRVLATPWLRDGYEICVNILDREDFRTHTSYLEAENILRKYLGPSKETDEGDLRCLEYRPQAHRLIERQARVRLPKIMSHGRHLR